MKGGRAIVFALVVLAISVLIVMEFLKLVSSFGG